MVLPHSSKRGQWSRKWESHEPDAEFAKLSWIETFVEHFKKNAACFTYQAIAKAASLQRKYIICL